MTEFLPKRRKTLDNQSTNNGDQRDWIKGSNFNSIDYYAEYFRCIDTLTLCLNAAGPNSCQMGPLLNLETLSIDTHYLRAVMR